MKDDDDKNYGRHRLDFRVQDDEVGAPGVAALITVAAAFLVVCLIFVWAA